MLSQEGKEGINNMEHDIYMCIQYACMSSLEGKINFGFKYLFRYPCSILPSPPSNGPKLILRDMKQAVDTTVDTAEYGGI